jgi:hypothetical protein
VSTITNVPELLARDENLARVSCSSQQGSDGSRRFYGYVDSVIFPTVFILSCVGFSPLCKLFVIRHAPEGFKEVLPQIFVVACISLSVDMEYTFRTDLTRAYDTPFKVWGVSIISSHSKQGNYYVSD